MAPWLSRPPGYDPASREDDSLWSADLGGAPSRGRFPLPRRGVSDQWNAPVLPQGGITTALALRAMSAAPGTPGQSLRTVTTIFAGQVPPGPVDIDVTLLRVGRTTSRAAATVHPTGQTSGHSAVAVFGETRPGFEFTELTYPEVAPPEQYPSFRDPLPEGVIGESDLGPVPAEPPALRWVCGDREDRRALSHERGRAVFVGDHLLRRKPGA